MAISKRKDRTGKLIGYQVSVSLRDPATGQMTRRVIGTFLRRKDADVAERNAKIAIQNGTFELEPAKAVGPMTVRDAVELWFGAKKQKVQPNTATVYRSAIDNHILPALAKVAIVDLTHDDVQRQVNRWRDNAMGVRLLHMCVMVLRASLARQVKSGTIPTNPADGIEKPSARVRKDFTIWTDEEAERFRAVAEADRMAPLWFLTLMEGMRQSEALGLRWRDLQWSEDESSCVARITQTHVPDPAHGGKAMIQDRAKTRGSQRAVMLTGPTIAVLKAHRDRQRFVRQKLGGDWTADDLIITTTIGTPVTPSTVKRTRKALIKKAGVPDDVTTHGLRHMAATVMLKAGASPALVALKLGHRDIGTTVDLYGHLDVADQSAANAALEAAAERGKAVLSREEGSAG